MSADFWICIPARLHSSRLPRKALVDLHGQPMVVRVVQAAQRTRASRIVVATDDESIASAVRATGVDCLMTSPDHPSGTDRLAEVAHRCQAGPDQLIVNLQGDEPLMPPEPLTQVALALSQDPSASVATAVTAITDHETFQNPNVVKAVLDDRQHALYFSRAGIPFHRAAHPASTRDADQPEPLGWRHLGLYAYKAGALAKFAGLRPSPAEQFEQLEQLRWLHHGHQIRCVILDQAPPPGVDTAEDLEAVRKALAHAPAGL
jgi:3-deoxy-manno-octulosonate cytidylyltransferase (CMP-KDO synthetase)